MKHPDLIAFLKSQVTPLEDSIHGPRYRAAAWLTDGTYLPCVVFQDQQKLVDLASRRFDETRASASHEYLAVVETFVASGSRLALWNIQRVETSPFAWDIEVLRRIHGETTMGWTSFVVEMKDGKYFNLGTSFHSEFFDLPAGYTFHDITTVHSGMVYHDTAGLKPFAWDLVNSVKVYRDKPFFTCYVQGLAAP